MCVCAFVLGEWLCRSSCTMHDALTSKSGHTAHFRAFIRFRDPRWLTLVIASFLYNKFKVTIDLSSLCLSV